MAGFFAVEGLSVTFGNAVALRDVSFSVDEGEVVGVLGANGAGKTTLLRGILARVERASGRVLLEGKDVTACSTRELVRAGISMTPENRRLFPNMSLEDNLRLGAYGQPRAVVRERLDRILSRFAWMAPRCGDYAGSLSGGEQQLVALARSLMAEPRLLLLDEPSSGLSPIAIEQVSEVLTGIARDGTAIVLVEQNVKLVSDLCTNAWILAHGEVKEHGVMADLMAGVRVADVYLGEVELGETNVVRPHLVEAPTANGEES